MSVRAQLREILFDPTLGPTEKRSQIEALDDVQEYIIEGLQDCIAGESWAPFERWLFAAYVRPSHKMTELLCGVLDRRIREVNNEDLVEVLAVIGDPSALSSLKGALWWDRDFDDANALAVKCVWAVGDIGTHEGHAILEEAASVGSSEVREWAEHLLLTPRTERT